jgi:hypothetical protein
MCYMYPLTLLGNGLVNTFLEHEVHMQQWKSCCSRPSLCHLCLIKGMIISEASYLQDKCNLLEY